MPSESFQCEPIAIVGSSCRFPGPAKNPPKLWELLRNPHDISREIPQERFNIDSFYHPDPKHHGSISTRRAYFLEEDYRAFDASFFQINAREAETMDPQQRILLEIIYEAMESGGHSIEGMQHSRTAVFVGGMSCDFRDTVAVRDPASIPEYSATGTHDSILAARISYFFDWKGPCMSIDTACSSSLVAVHQAVRALRNSEATAAVAAGCNLNLGPEQFIALSNLRMLSPSGRVRMWDKDADGYARGEGFGAVILKTLSRAEADGDRIECIIRESGVNQDGRTMGMTMPNAESQTALIREVYQRAGLDVSNPIDKPQYFEAHGTGTPAGDPVEAEAIYRAFCSLPSGSDEPLYVGSIKTVTGHLEGAAGIAGLLKASLAVQNGIIPPNLHFGQLNPGISRYYEKLQIIAGQAKPWPALPAGVPRRASVNSFGFGGTNAHIILESYTPKCPSQGANYDTMRPVPALLTVSAKSEGALFRRIAAVAAYIERSGPQVDLDSLAYTLQTRQSQFAFRRTFTSNLWTAMVHSMRKASEPIERPIIVTPRPGSATPRLLGVFTGQGAQSARMGAELIERSAEAQKKVRFLEEVLGSLPHPPPWSLAEELSKPASSSRLGEAALSQPLCTALQIIIVDHLHAAGIEFNVVLGHSSGEIAAVYAAGFLSARDAICIAYYRGSLVELSKSHTEDGGAMLATGIPFEDSRALCEQPKYVGRLSAAASNSPSSSTLSGDMEAVQEAKAFFDNNGIFARRLVVDAAYHSHHMYPVAGSYINALQQCGIVPHTSTKQTIFLSSVYESDDIYQDFGPRYWENNMVRPVLFSQAVQRAVSEYGPYDIALEIGPHPALKGPLIETLDACSSSAVYCGTLKRGQDSIQTLSETIGFLHERIHPLNISFEDYRKMFLGDDYQIPNIIPDLPSYPWDHERVFYRESRLSHSYLHDLSPEHGLLGKRLPYDDNKNEMRWRQVISLDEINWLSEHKVQGQIVVPAMWYMAMVLEASLIAAKGPRVETIEIKDFQIEKAIAIDEGDSVETIFSLKMTRTEDRLHAIFWCLAGSLCSKADLDSVFSGELTMSFGKGQEANNKPAVVREDVPSSMRPIDPARLYAFLQAVGYGYDGWFKGLRTTFKDETVSQARTTASHAPPSDWLVHPVTLDLALQSLLAAHFNLDDDGMPLVVPQAVGRVVLYPQRCRPNSWAFNAIVTDWTHQVMTGDVEITDQDGQIIMLVEDASWRPLTVATRSNDRNMFYTTVWEWDLLHGAPITVSPYTDEEVDLVHACDRVAAYYYRAWKQALTSEDLTNAKWHHHRLLAYIEYLLPNLATGQVPTLQKWWLADTKKDINALIEEHPKSVDLLLMQAVGENLLTSIRDNRPILEFMLQEGRLANYYQRGLGYEKCYEILKTMVRRIVHRYPRIRVLEVGAGTGGATRHILDALDGTFVSYTFTDVSAGFFEKAKDSFARESSSKVIFKTLDLEQDALEQGLEAGTFDLVIGSLVIHATGSIENTLQNLRRLIKPGGYLLLVEGTAETLRSGFMMAGLPGWWVGGEDRKMGPMIGLDRWDELLRKTGFSGVDVPVKDSKLKFINLGVVFASQAVNESVSLIRDPLGSSTLLEDMVIVGDPEDLYGVKKLLRPHHKRLLQADSLSDSALSNVPSKSCVLVLSEANDPMFRSTTAEKLAGLKQICAKSSKILMVTQIREAAGAYASAMLGLVRSLRIEIPHLCIQTMSVRVKPSLLDIKRICESFISLAAWSGDDNALGGLEPELELVDGQVRLPRIVEDTPPNRRLNSRRRFMTNHIDPSKTSVGVTYNEDHGNLSFRYPRQHLDASTFDNGVTAMFSIAQPVFLATKPYYLCAGRLEASQRPVLALGLENRSIMEPVALHSRDTEHGEDVVEWLKLISYHLFAQDCVGYQKDNCLFYLHDADNYLVAAFHDVCHKTGAMFHLSSSEKKDGHVHIPAHISRRRARKLFTTKAPHETNVFIDGSRAGISALIEACVPGSTCLKPLSQVPAGYLSTTEVDLNTYMQAATTFADSHLRDVGSQSHPTILRDPKPKVIKWHETQSITIEVQNVTDTFQLLRHDRTYLLVGLTGDMGRVLVDWLVENGARHIALASRNPAIKQDWVRALEDQGVVITVYRMDVCDVASVQATRSAIFEDHSVPVGGIANGAMVLRDTSFYEMRYEEMIDCLRPKLDGSKNLDQVFNDVTLDFFVMFSSLAYTLGNPGQSNYAAANGFMKGIARSRRQRGQAASIISLGVVGGVGYLARTRNGTEHEHAKKRNVLTISPDEMCIIFAEGIVAGHPESGHDVEVITGLDGRINSKTMGKQSLAPWLRDPRMSHIVIDRAQVDEARVGGITRVQTGETVPLRFTLSAEYDDVRASAILLKAFSRKLERMSLMQEGDSTLVPMTELGVDSLLAIEIRSWLMSELGADVPVLKVLGGGSAADIVQVALKIFRSASQSSTSTSLAAEEQSSSDHNTIATPRTDGELELNNIHAVRHHLATSAQARMYRLHQFTSGAAHVNNMSWSYRIIGALDAQRFERALLAVLRPYEALRTQFSASGEQVIQTVFHSMPIPLRRHQLAKETDIDALFGKISRAPHDLSSGNIVNASLVEKSPTEHVFIMSFHHIAVDTRSCEILLADLEQAYASPSTFVSSHTKSRMHPTDYAALENRALSSGAWKQSIDFWKEHLRGASLVLPLFACARVDQRTVLGDYHLNGHHMYLSQDLVEQVKALCRDVKCSPYHFHTAVFAVLLHQLTRMSNIIIGSVDAGRDTHPAFSDAFGPMFNYLPLHLRHIPDRKTFRDLVRYVRDTSYAARGHACVPFDVIVDAIGVERIPTTHHPVYQAQINYLKHNLEGLPLGPGCAMTLRDARGVEVSYDFCVSVLEGWKGQGARIAFETQEYLYDSVAVKELGGSYMRILEQVVTNMEMSL